MTFTSATADQYPDLISSANNGEIIFATDDFFAVAENMLSPTEPLWDPSTFGPQGKVMDGWETRRKRTLGHDYCIIKLGYPGQIVGVDCDTAWFTGNNAPAFSIQATSIPSSSHTLTRSKASESDLITINTLNSDNWATILPFTVLRPGLPETRHHFHSIHSIERFTYIRFNIYPDGGVARLRVYGIVIPHWTNVAEYVNAADLGLGAKALSYSNAHYGNPMRLLAPERSTGMHDGWETARNPNRPSIFKLGSDGLIEQKGSEWTIIHLACPCDVKQIIVDTNHYKGNYPQSCEIQQGTGTDLISVTWIPLLKRSVLGPDQEHVFDDVEVNDSVSFVRLVMYPDGGISRLRILGRRRF